MSSSALPEGFRSRPATMDDAAAVARIVAACEAAYDLGTHTSETDVRDDWQGIDLDDESLVVEDADGVIVASCDIVNRHYSAVSAYGYVHPDSEGQGLGRYLVAWAEQWARDRMDRARADAQVVVRHYVNANNAGALELFANCGYAHVRNTFVMAIELDAAPPAPEWPDGITAGVYRPGVDERAIYEAVEDAFRDTWGRPPSTFERFMQFAKGEGVQPELWALAWAGEEVAGVCLGTVAGEHGWIPTVGVRRAWRRKGLGLALLRACFTAYYQRGVSDVRLSVDAQSLTGATRLYERAGMRVASNFALYAKTLREGVDLSEEASQ